MTTPDTDPTRRDYTLKAPIIQAGVERHAGDVVSLRGYQARRLADQGVIDLEAPAKPGRAHKQEG